MDQQVRATPKVSVIIPVYNVEMYLPDCLETLLNQTLRQCEFIFVNDGSTDGSRSVIERYQSNDRRIKLINQPNSGVSAARNAGLTAAGGEYIGFVDADDWVEPDMFETLYSVASEGRCDIVFSDHYSETNGSEVLNRCPFTPNISLDRSYIVDRILPQFIESDELNSICTKLFRKQLLDDFSLFLENGVALGEDGIFNMKVLNHSELVTYVNYSGYHYRDRQGSATRNAAQIDYISRAIEVYLDEPPIPLDQILDPDKVKAKKAVKLVRSVIAFLHVYCMPETNVSFLQKYYYVHEILQSKAIHEALIAYMEQFGNQLGRYERSMLFMIKAKMTIGLFGLTAYSRYRNNENVWRVKK